MILKNFTNPEETKCKCGCGLQVKDKIMILLQAFIYILEFVYGGTITCVVNSGARCPKHNAAEGGALDSQHPHLCAVDCKFFLGKKQLNNSEIATHAVNSRLFTGVGWKRYITQGLNLIHLDCRTGNRIAKW